jgi:hypothetical protein
MLRIYMSGEGLARRTADMPDSCLWLSGEASNGAGRSSGCYPFRLIRRSSANQCKLHQAERSRKKGPKLTERSYLPAYRNRAFIWLGFLMVKLL